MSVSDGSYVTELAERWSSACAEVQLELGGFAIFLGDSSMKIQENPRKINGQNQHRKSTAAIFEDFDDFFRNWN
jgi:hypothetical protein